MKFDPFGSLFGIHEVTRKEALEYLLKEIPKAREVKAFDNSSIFYDVLNNAKGVGGIEDIDIEIITTNIDNSMLPEDINEMPNISLFQYKYNIDNKFLVSFWVIDKKKVLTSSLGYIMALGEKNGTYGFIHRNPIFLQSRYLVDFYKYLDKSERIAQKFLTDY